MQTLPHKINKNSYEYTQVLRGKKTCIYEQRVCETIKYYEVFMIRIKPNAIINGKLLNAKERFPHNEAFGKWAWTFNTLNKAMIKFEHLELTL